MAQLPVTFSLRGSLHSDSVDDHMNVSGLFAWEEFVPGQATSTTTEVPHIAQPAKGFASKHINQKVFISMTCTSFRIDSVHRVIGNIFAGYMWPDRLFLVLSSTPYLLDRGVTPSDIPDTLIALTRKYPFSIVYTG